MKVLHIYTKARKKHFLIRVTSNFDYWKELFSSKKFIVKEVFYDRY